MVKGYDPTKSDPSKILLEYLLRWSTSDSSLKPQEALKYTKFWLKNSQSTSSIYKKFQNLENQTYNKPQIILKNKCSSYLKWESWKLLFSNQPSSDQNYPAFSNNNKITICLNKITNKTQLKQNLDRQLTILWKKAQRQSKQSKLLVNRGKIKQQNIIEASPHSFKEQEIQKRIQEKDKQLIQILYQGCKQGYTNYLLEKDIEERISKKCAKYLFFRRCERLLPLDAKFRYASKIIQQAAL